MLFKNQRISQGPRWTSSSNQTRRSREWVQRLRRCWMDCSLSTNVFNGDVWLSKPFENIEGMWHPPSSLKARASRVWWYLTSFLAFARNVPVCYGLLFVNQGKHLLASGELLGCLRAFVPRMAVLLTGLSVPPIPGRWLLARTNSWNFELTVDSIAVPWFTPGLNHIPVKFPDLISGLILI